MSEILVVGHHADTRPKRPHFLGLAALGDTEAETYKISRWGLQPGFRFVPMTGAAVNDDRVEDAWPSAEEYLKRFFSATPKQKSRLVKKAPLAALQATALHHPDPFARRGSLFFLDHYANEVSTQVFAQALHDPVDFVRNAALHSIGCESCRTVELCVADVVPDIVGVLEDDPSPELRMKAIPTLLRLAGRDSRAWEAIGRAVEHDPDGIVRQAAADALRGNFVAPRKRYERHQRRHDRQAARTATAASSPPPELSGRTRPTDTTSGPWPVARVPRLLMGIDHFDC
jgi:HEAT repeats